MYFVLHILKLIHKLRKCHLSVHWWESPPQSLHLNLSPSRHSSHIFRSCYNDWQCLLTDGLFIVPLNSCDGGRLKKGTGHAFASLRPVLRATLRVSRCRLRWAGTRERSQQSLLCNVRLDLFVTNKHNFACILSF